MIKTHNAQRTTHNANGFTLIETLLVIVVLAICLAPLCILVVNVVQKNSLSQAQATATGLAEAEMERVTSLRFSTVNDAAQAPFSNPFSSYSYEIAVDYVDANDLNTPVVGPTDYKRAQVKVSNAIIGSLTLTSLAANDW